MIHRPTWNGVVFGWIVALATSAPAGERATENVFFVMTDGLRWQELFSGAEEQLISKERGGVENVDEVKERFWRDSAEERRKALMPFFWSVVAKEGQVFGNQRLGSVASVTNGRHFSYPGYSEVLCGFPDIAINSNAKILNRNVTVLEWLNNKPEYKGKVAGVTSWEVFPFIINAPRSGIPVNSGFEPLKEIPSTPEVEEINRVIAETPHPGKETRFDDLTFQAAMACLRAMKPRVLFISFDETDANGHGGRYDKLLDAAHRVDGYLRELWETAQSMDEYRGKTTLVITTDHGRGFAPEGWKNHSLFIPGSAFIWAAFLGPDTPALGERKEVEKITQSQIAATVAQLLGEDYVAEQPKAAQPVPGVVAGK